MPTNGRFLLDTNIVTALFAGEASVIEHLGTADEVFLPVPALGELYYGARKSARAAANLARLDEFAASVTVNGSEPETARQYGLLKHQLRTKGRPLPENDIWIAALALEHDLTLVTRDRHFLEIDGLNHTAW